MLGFLVYQCGICDELFETGKLLNDHLHLHEDVSDRPVKREHFECYICKTHKTKTAKDMRKHMRQHRQKRCEICKEILQSMSHLCGNNIDVQCEYCSERFKTTENMRKHLVDVHKSNQRLYQCKMCPKYFPMIFLRDCHQATHTKRQEQQCDICPKKFVTKLRLARHKEIHRTQKCKNNICVDWNRTERIAFL